jgi:Domain of unknown function (DUF6268)
MRKYSMLFVFGISMVTLAQSQIKKTKPLCNPLVIGSVPKKALSLQYDLQTAFSNKYAVSTNPPALANNTFYNVQSMRLNYNKTAVTKPKTYLTVDIGYWLSSFRSKLNTTPLLRTINDFTENSFHSLTASTNIFKPLDAKHFILLNASLEVNGNTESFKKFGAKNIFAGGAAIYGWKKGFSSITGVGILRAYRLGRVIHIPAFLWNKSFNKKWGVEMLLPARGIVRYTPNKQNIFVAGFDLEGGQFAFNTRQNNATINNSFLQRGEIRPKIGWETNLGKNMKFTANTGMRINGRMNLAQKYDGEKLVLKNTPENSLFVNIGLHIVSVKAKTKPKKK